MATLSGCGFKPLYGRAASGGGPVAEFSFIEIGAIPDRTGQLLRIALEERLTPRGRPSAPRYMLEVGLQESRSDLVIQRDASSTRAKLRIDASWVLKDLATNAPMLRGASQSTTTFNIVESEFATISAENDARRRAGIEIADDIRLRLGLYFNRRRAG